MDTREECVKKREQLEAFQRFSTAHVFASCRLVHYAGNGKPNAIDVSLHEIERQVAGCLAEGFLVDWLNSDGRLYLCVQEPDCPMPPWEKVIAEEAAVDVDALLYAQGLGGA